MKYLLINFAILLSIFCYSTARKLTDDFIKGLNVESRCIAHNGLEGECIPEFECSSSRRGIGTLKVCQKFGFFTVVCCPFKSNPGILPVIGFPKLEYSNCGDRSLNKNIKFSTIRKKRRALEVSAFKATNKPSVVGGIVSEKESWPWMAAIYEKSGDSYDFLCGGALINDRYLVTAAHCFKITKNTRINPKNYFVRMREHDTRDANKGDQYQVERVIAHEGYLPPVDYNDIALLKLSTKVRIYDKVKPVCLPINAAKDNTFEKSLSTVLGWGTTSFAGRSSALLREVVIPIASNRDCDKSYKRIRATADYPDGIISSQVCAGEKKGGKDACQGDSGGPLMVKLNGKFTLVGVVSGGFQCARPNFPGVYTRVTSYLNWMNKNID